MPCAATAASCSRLPRMYSNPPCTRGMQGLYAAVQHLGKAGEVADVLDGKAGLAQRPAVPPVEISSTPKPASTWANSTRPVLSVTLSSARQIRFSWLKAMLLVFGPGGVSVAQRRPFSRLHRAVRQPRWGGQLGSGGIPGSRGKQPEDEPAYRGVCPSRSGSRRTCSAR